MIYQVSPHVHVVWIRREKGARETKHLISSDLSNSEKCSKVLLGLFLTNILMLVLYSVSEQVISIFNIFVNCGISLFNNLNLRKFGNCPYTCNFLFRYMTSFSLNLNLMQPLSLKPNFTFYRLIYEL